MGAATYATSFTAFRSRVARFVPRFPYSGARAGGGRQGTQRTPFMIRPPSPIVAVALSLVSQKACQDIKRTAREMGVAPESLRRWARHVDTKSADREGLSGEKPEELRRLRECRPARGEGGPP